MNKEMSNSSFRVFAGVVSALVLVLACAVVYLTFFTPKVAYVNSQKLMTGFSEAAQAQKEIKAEDDKWRSQLKELEDTLQAAINQMSKEYNTAKPDRKKQLQDKLSAENQNVNNFKQANIRKMEQVKQEKLQGVINKVNVFVAEYGKKKGYTLILATTMDGDIAYGSDKCDITDALIQGLNARYK